VNETLDKLYKNPDNNKNIEENFQFILFGGTGDLAHNKIIPAFYNLAAKDILPNQYTIIATGRRYDNKKEYLDALYNSLVNKKEKVDNRIWQLLADHIDYFQLSFKDDNDFKRLKKNLENKAKKEKVSDRKIEKLWPSGCRLGK